MTEVRYKFDETNPGAEAKGSCFMYACGCASMPAKGHEQYSCRIHGAFACFIEYFFEEEGPFNPDFLSRWKAANRERWKEWLGRQPRRIALPSNMVNQIRSTKYLYEDSRPKDYPQEGKNPQDSCPSDFVAS